MEMKYVIDKNVSKKKGRGLRSLGNICRGDTVLLERPVSLGVAFSLLSQGRCCESCLNFTKSSVAFTVRCATCQFSSFCSKACLKLHTTALCRRNQCLREMTPFMMSHSEDTQDFLMSMISLCLYYVEHNEIAQDLCVATGGQVTAGMELSEELADMWAFVCGVVNSALGAQEDDPVFDPSPGLFARLCGIETTNSLSVTHGRVPIGRWMFLDTSKCNHSCVPNLARIRKDSKLQLVATRDISDGEELCITYLDLSLDKRRRNASLMESFGFECDCSRCEKDFVMELCGKCRGQLVGGDCVVCRI